MANYYETYSTNPVVAACEKAVHATSQVRECSPDPVLSHDGETSNACRQCPCGKYGTHVFGCSAGAGPVVDPETQRKYHEYVAAAVEYATEQARIRASTEFAKAHDLTLVQISALRSGRDR